MKKSVGFQRWKARERSTWPFQVFQLYGRELDQLLWTQKSAHAFTYKQLKTTGADWADLPSKHFKFPSLNEAELYKDLRAWSDAYNQFDNWNNLNALIALSSNLETYMASVIALALDSDPGLLLGIPGRIDGIAILKHGSSTVSYEEKIKACTKGDWQARVNAFKGIFGAVPDAMQRHLGELDKIRNLRNKIGHAFGRDIDEARKHGVKDILPMEPLKVDRLTKWARLLWGLAKGVDLQLLRKHIGEFQALRFYHNLYPSLRQDVAQGHRAHELRKAIGRFKAQAPGAQVCKELVQYYEAL